MNLTYILQWETEQFITFGFQQLFYLVFVISLVIVYPFYTYVYKLNRENEQLTAVYPIMNHYHFALKFILTLGVIMTFYHFYELMDLGIMNDDDNEIPMDTWDYIKEGIFDLVYYLNQFSLHLFTRVHCFLISIVAIQRSIIWFFPASEPYVNLNQKTMNLVIKFIYTVIGILVLSFLVFNAFSIIPSTGDDITWKSISPYAWFYISFDLLFFLTACLYIPILISIRKYSHLRSVVQNQPQKYVMYQCLIFFIMKTTHYPLSLYLIMSNSGINAVIEFMIEIDFLNIPLIIQTSYLFCNKRNVNLLFSRNLLRMMCCRRSNTVEPMRSEGVESTH